MARVDPAHVMGRQLASRRPFAIREQPVMEPAARVFQAIHTQSLTPVQEAAVMYANGRSDEAQRLLQQALDAGADGDERPWHLLLGLYRIEGDWQSFEPLAARFERTFQHAAPNWLSEESLAHLPPEMHPGGEVYCALAGALDRRSAAKLEPLSRLAQRHASVHIDASKVTGVDSDGCRSLAQLLASLSGNGNGVVLTGAEGLTRLLRQAVDGDGSQTSCWTLLLELLRLRGLQADFERAALEYALAAGVAPPAWRPALMPVVAPHGLQEKRDEPRYQAGPEVIRVTDVLAGATDRQLDALQSFAAERQYINVNLASLVRIDLAAASALVGLVNGLAAGGKVVRLLRPNPLVEALLETLHLDPRVQLVRAAA
jgi:ABC-type transporter Mla MlaB component